jgi:hypothetical protein
LAPPANVKGAACVGLARVRSELRRAIPRQYELFSEDEFGNAAVQIVEGRGLLAMDCWHGLQPGLGDADNYRQWVKDRGPGREAI